MTRTAYLSTEQRDDVGECDTYQATRQDAMRYDTCLLDSVGDAFVEIWYNIYA